jgi:hypothetical protein
MKLKLLSLLFVLTILGANVKTLAGNDIPAGDPKIQYFGRWDFSDPAAPTHSWPGVYIYAEFEGTSIAIKTDDNFNYYNIFIDDVLQPVFHGTKSGVNTYTVAAGLTNRNHKILITVRGETNWTKFAFNGFVLDDGKNLLTPASPPQKKVEFVGDSYTVASGNLWTNITTAPDGDYTDTYQGFAPIIARKLNAQYTISAISGNGLVHDWEGNKEGNIPDKFNRALAYTTTPLWDFSRWIPNLVVICLGLNDFSGWDGYNKTISQENSDIFKAKYHEFLGTLMNYYPGTKFLCVAANDLAWIKKNVSEVVTEERGMGNKNVFYTYFPNYYTEFVNNGHPSVSAHLKIADKIVASIDTIDAWTPYVGTKAPIFVSAPQNQISVASTFLLKVTTDKYAIVKYSTQNKDYELMENTFTTTGALNHSLSLTLKPGVKNTYYLRAKDIYGNKMDTSAVVSITYDTTKVLLDWKAVAFDVSKWKKGMGPLGNDQAAAIKTTIGATQTAYFRKNFSLTNASSVKDMRILVTGHSGAVAYINGDEIGRLNISAVVTPAYEIFAPLARTLNNTLTFSTGNLAKLKNGENVLEVEMHSASSPTPTVAFDGKLYDVDNKVYFDAGSEWTYYDAGKAPEAQLVSKPTGIASNNALPVKIKLFQNYPNPFNPATIIAFQIPSTGHVALKVFDMLGREVAELINEVKSAGTHEVRFEGSKLASGVYVYQLVSGNKILSNKLILMK